MPICPTCRSPLKRDITGLLRCGVCGFNYKLGQSAPLLQGYTPKKQIIAKNKDDADVDLTTFINRVLQRLCPIYKAYPERTKKALMKTRSKIRGSLQQVVDGKTSFQKWFDEIHRDLGKHPIDLAKILYESTEDLNSHEAKELRKGCEQYLQFLTNMYNPQLTAGAGRGSR